MSDRAMESSTGHDPRVDGPSERAVGAGRPAPTTLCYHTSPTDHIAKLERYVADSRTGRWFTFVAYVVIVALAWTSSVLFYVKQRERNHAYLLSGAFAAVLTLSLPWLYRQYQDSFWRSILTTASLRGVVGETTLVLDDAGIEERGPMTTVRARWDEVIGVDRSVDRTIIVVAPLVSIAVPRTAFADPHARMRFERLLDARRAIDGASAQG